MSKINPQFHEALTDREREVLDCLVEGLTNREISERLFIAETTVSWYNRQIYNKLGVDNRRQAAQYARENAVFDSPSIKSQSETPTKHNLPASTFPFVGRNNEIKKLHSLLTDDATRLITILAPGGMGKTRLALETARSFLQSFQDGVYFIPLQSIAEASQIMEAVGKQIQPTLVADGLSLDDHVLDILKNKQMLLIMDNYEHVLDGAHYVTDILEQAPDIKIVVTSRQRLNFHSETILRLSGLSRVSNKQPSDAEILCLDSVKRLNPEFVPSDDDHNAIEQVCQLTEGMPLAIMLAAGWSNTLTLSQIAREITKGIDFLASESGDLPERHQAIRSVFEPTWWRLSYDERLAFTRLSVFAGGCTYDAAVEVAQTNANILRSLVNHSLLILTDGGRYEIHELLRQYGEEKLVLLDEDQATVQAHATYYAKFMEWYGANYFKEGTYDKMVVEQDNIRKMWWHLVESEQWELMETTQIGMRRWMNFFSNHHEVAHWMESAIKMLEASDELEEQQSLYGCLHGCLYYAYMETRNYEMESVAIKTAAIFRNCELNVFSAYLLINANLTGRPYDDYSLEDIAARVIPIFQEYDYPDGHGITLIQLAYKYFVDRHIDQALMYARQAIEIGENAGDLAVRGWASGVVGEIMIYCHQYQEALDGLHQHYEDFKRFKQVSYINHILWNIARVYFLCGQNDDALHHLELALQHSQQTDLLSRQLNDFFEICQLYLELGQIEQAEHYLHLARDYAVLHPWLAKTIRTQCNDLFYSSWIDLMRGHYQEAEIKCQHSLNLLKDADHPWLRNLIPVQKHIYAEVLMAQERLDEARHLIASAIPFVSVYQRYKQIQMIITYACLLDEGGQVELLTLVANHPGTAQTDRDRVNTMLDDLSQTIDLVVFQEAVRRGQSLDLDTVIDQLTT